ncbi:MAG: hypothetical protein COA97_10730 [Flavobacteriales bacterium]|nr:MAG: hypothetical protein COA97_10730 [Flavobacteriales bacterium]
MKKIILVVVLAVFSLSELNAQIQYKVVTVVESIVPMGIGRSRIIEATADVNYEQFTTERTGGKDSKQGKIKRGEAKIDAFRETKLLNFYSGVGLNFQNIASNDALITSMLNGMSKDGWELFSVAAGVESKGSKDDKQGIFITRYLFKK